MEDRLHALILEKRQVGRKIGENWIRRHTRLEFESLWPERVTIVEKRKVFAGMAFSNGWFCAFLKRSTLVYARGLKEHRLYQKTIRIKSLPGFSLIGVLKLGLILSSQR